MKKIVVLGAGLVGKAIAVDVNKNFDVTSVDINQDALTVLKNECDIDGIQADISDKKTLKEIVAKFDFVVSAVPGFMGFKTLQYIIEAGKNVVDIAFFPEDALLLDELAKKHNVTAITDCGVAPGMGNVILGYHNERMQINDYKCYVGGLPVVREWPYEYKAVFSPIDVIEEYTREARYVQSGEIVRREALSDAELLHFDKVGSLEAWNSDGLRSLIQTMQIPNMIEKTLRYPGSIEYLRVLRETGFFSYDEIEVNGAKVRPIDVTSKLLFPKWQLKPGEEDFTVMRIIIEGTENNQQTKYVYDLYDRFDTKNNVSSMARTTGYTATAAVNMLISGLYKNAGINPPEYLGKQEEHFRFMLAYLKDRNVIYNVS